MLERAQRIAVTSRDGVSVNERFHRARDFFVFEVSGPTPDGPRFLERRTLPPSDPGAAAVLRDLDVLAELLADCAAIVSLGFTAGARRELSGRGFAPIELRGSIPAAIGVASSQLSIPPGRSDPQGTGPEDLSPPGGARR